MDAPRIVGIRDTKTIVMPRLDPGISQQLKNRAQSAQIPESSPGMTTDARRDSA